MTTQQKLIKSKMNLLELADYLNDVKVVSFTPDSVGSVPSRPAGKIVPHSQYRMIQ